MPSHHQARPSPTLALLLMAAAVHLVVVGEVSASSTKKKSVVPAVIVFGNWTVNTGNNNAIGTVLKRNFPPYGRDLHLRGGGTTGWFCNMRLPPDFVSEALNLPTYLDPDPAYSIKGKHEPP